MKAVLSPTVTPHRMERDLEKDAGMHEKHTQIKVLSCNSGMFM